MAETQTEEGHRKYYPYAPADAGSARNLLIYTGEVVKVYGNDSPPPNASQFAPPAAMPGRVAYFDGRGWLTALDIRQMTLAQRQRLTIAALDERFRINVDSLTAGYTEQEKFTWAAQEAEARAYKAGAEASYLLRTLASANNYTVDHLCDRVILKADMFRQLCSDVLAKYQRTKNKIEAATTAEELPTLTVQDFHRMVMFVTM